MLTQGAGKSQQSKRNEAFADPGRGEKSAKCEEGGIC